MRNFQMKNIIFFFITVVFVIPSVSAYAGDLPANDVRMVRTLLLQPDVDFTLYNPGELFDSLTWLLENDNTDLRERVVRKALCALPDTNDPRAVEYLSQYIDVEPLHCINGLGYFSTPESCQILLARVNAQDEYVRMFCAQSLGMLNYTTSEELWAMRDQVITSLAERRIVETEDWILPVIESSFVSSVEQVFVPE